MIDAVRHFLYIVLEGETPTIAALSRALDRLAVAYHDTPGDVPTPDSPEPPERDWAMAKAIGARFPDFGYYAVANPLIVIDGKPGVGDAIDDLDDIARDLTEVLWYWENRGAQDANWSYRFLYECHWGQHLHWLRNYLHARQFYADGA